LLCKSPVAASQPHARSVMQNGSCTWF